MPDSLKMPPVSDTAFFCCGIRELDAASEFPICNDVYAQNFMTDAGRKAFQKYKPSYFAKGLNFARPKIIDDIVSARIRENPKLKIILIGAGFDSRAYRIAGGDWLEIDEEAIIAYKNRYLPLENCPNTLRRLSIDFSRDSLADLLKIHGEGESCLYIVEGVFMYLEINEIKKLLDSLQADGCAHTLVCDLMTHSFINIFGKSSKKLFDESGAVIKCQSDEPETLFLDHQYTLKKEISIVESAIHYGAILLPKLLIPKILKKGFRVMLFEFGANPNSKA